MASLQGYGHGNRLNVTENLSLYYTDRSLMVAMASQQGYGHGNQSKYSTMTDSQSI